MSGVWHWSLSSPMRPDTTCIGPRSSVRHAIATMQCMPLNPEVNGAAVHPKVTLSFSDDTICELASLCLRQKSIVLCGQFSALLAGLFPDQSQARSSPTDVRRPKVQSPLLTAR